MESPQALHAWYFFSEDVPDEEVIVPIKTPRGLAFAVRTGASSEAIVKALNENAEFVLGVGLAQLGQTEKPPD